VRQTKINFSTTVGGSLDVTADRLMLLRYKLAINEAALEKWEKSGPYQKDGRYIHRLFHWYELFIAIHSA